MSDSFGEEPRKQCQKVLECLIDIASSQGGRVENIVSEWKGRNNFYLQVSLRLDNLERMLVEHYEWKWSETSRKPKTYQALRRALRHLGQDWLNFDDSKIQGIKGRGKESGWWKFKLKNLPSKDKDKIFRYFEEEWGNARQKKGLPNNNKLQQESKTLKDIWYLNKSTKSHPIKTSNGIIYEVFKLECIQVKRFDRGKRYDLKNLPDREKRRIDTVLGRHSKVVNQLEGVNGIPVNRDVFDQNVGNQEYKWVIDQRIEGKTLESFIRPEPEQRLTIAQLKKFSRSLLTILKRLHAADIILRDLHPKSIIIRSSDKQPFVLDFELAKMVKGQSTVSHGELFDNPFRAPEMVAGDENPTVRADLYSWASVVIAAATGCMEPNTDVLATCRANLPENLYRQLELCFDILPDERPESTKDVLKGLGF